MYNRNAEGLDKCMLEKLSFGQSDLPTCCTTSFHSFVDRLHDFFDWGDSQFNRLTYILIKSSNDNNKSVNQNSQKVSPCIIIVAQQLF